MMFTILFGLSMDYEVFLLSRIREEWRRTGDNSEAVADGLARTGRVISAAAAIMFCVFGSFVIGDPLRILQVFGLGLAASILIDIGAQGSRVISGRSWPDVEDGHGLVVKSIPDSVGTSAA